MMRLKTRIVLVGMLTRLVVMSLLVGDVDGGSGALSGSSFAAVANNLSLLPLLQAVDRVAHRYFQLLLHNSGSNSTRLP